MRFHTCLLTAACAVGFLGTAAASGQHLSPDAKDAGVTPSSARITTSVILNVRDLKGLQKFVAETSTPGNPNYRHFLSVSQFAQRFAPSSQAVSKFVHYLQAYGITVNKVYPNNLDIEITGTAGALNAAFSTQLHDFTVNGQRFHRPAWKFVLPGEFAPLVLAVPGLNNEPAAYRPKNVHVGRGALARATPAAVAWPKNGTATGVPQQYTVGDVANFYGVNPLYQAGILGQGRTIGIMTLANFVKSDAYSYWSSIGLKGVLPNRITKVLVDGGTPVQAGVGDDETSLDVEQSGGLAPQAKLRVYIAPNTNNGFLDLFYTATAENLADTVSISWGEPEEFYFAALNGGVDMTGQLVALDQALMEGAAQGQSFFAASGDSGAFDINNPGIATYPYYSMQLSVDSPGNDPNITAAGGTTVATTIPGISANNCPAITLPRERVWGWDYLNALWGGCLQIPPLGLFPVGSGGGVSSFWPVPSYQQFVGGMQLTQPGQSLYYFPNYPSKRGAQDLIDLPAGFAGRNMPDISLNADPETGYIVVDCTDFGSAPGCAEGGWGGTSFVAPQLNGMTALIDQAMGGRVGLLNPTIYALQRSEHGTPSDPLKDVQAGDNWFYSGSLGYDDGSGLGTVNLAQLEYAYKVLPH